MPRPSDSLSTIGEKNGDNTTPDQQNSTATDNDRHSVSELVRNFSDPPVESQKRDRSESGDSAPAGKRGAKDFGGDSSRSPAPSNRNLKEYLETAIDSLESRIMVSISRDLHEFRDSLAAEISKLGERLTDLERHVEESDGIIAELTDDLRRSRAEVTALQSRVEEAEVNSRLPCLILSGPAMASRHAPRLEPPLPSRAAPAAADGSRPAAADPGPGHGIVTSRSADRQSGPPGAPGVSGDRRAAWGGAAGRGGRWEEREDVNALVVQTLNRCMPGLNLGDSDIDRAHRLPGPNNRVIVRFVRSGQNSVRDAVMSRRLELRGKELFVNESLTRLRGLIFRSLLAAKREMKIYTVFSRNGNVYFKEKQHGTSTRVDTLQALRELGYKALER